jgi:hypothetical protein
LPAAAPARPIYRSVLLPSTIVLAVGVGAAAGLSRFLEALLFQVQPADPRTLLGSGLTLLAVSQPAAAAQVFRS